MKTLIVGAGNIGTAIGYYFANICHKEISLIDADESALDKLKLKNFDLPKINCIKQNILLEKSINKVAKEYDVIISTLPWSQHVKLCKLLENFPIFLFGIARPDYDYYQEVVKNKNPMKATIIHGCGLEPGLTEIFTQFLINPLDEVDDVFIACGGIPLHPVPPMNYKLLFGVDTLPFQQRKTLRLSNGRISSVPRFGEVEEFFVDSVGNLECWNDGLTPWLAECLLGMGATTCVQKTVRWPGYAKIVKFLNQAGFLSEDNIQLTNKILIPKLQLEKNEVDVVIMRINVTGSIQNERQKASLEFIDYRNSQTGLTAMARTTGFSTAILAGLIWKDRNKFSGELMLTDCYSNEFFSNLYLQLRNTGMKINFKFTNFKMTFKVITNKIIFIFLL
jgi:lysine 6-dehydrogenase